VVALAKGTTHDISMRSRSSCGQLAKGLLALETLLELVLKTLKELFPRLL
jgi:hypothetical protein